MFHSTTATTRRSPSAPKWARKSNAGNSRGATSTKAGGHARSDRRRDAVGTKDRSPPAGENCGSSREIPMARSSWEMTESSIIAEMSAALGAELRR